MNKYPNEATRIQREALSEIFNFNIDLEEESVEIKNSPVDLIVFDTETTGLDSTKDKVVQLSGIKFSCENGILTEKERLDLFINQPEYDENAEIKDPIFERENGRKKTFLDLTGISNEKLSTCPTESEIFPKIYDFFGETPILVAHNTPFDWGFITAMYIRQGKNILTKPTNRFDTLAIARDIIPKEEAPTKVNEKGETKPTYTLGALAGMYGIDKSEDDSSETIAFHNSMNDVIVTSRLFRTLLFEYAQRLLAEKIEEASTPPIVKERAIVKSISFWEGYRGFSRVYVNATLRGSNASYYYDVRKKCWGERDEGTMVATDMDLLINDAFELAKVTNEADFAKVKDSITADDAFLSRYK